MKRLGQILSLAIIGAILSIHLPALVAGWEKDRGPWCGLPASPLSGNGQGYYTFPENPLETHVEIFYSGQWHDITSDIRGTDTIRIERGRADEASRVGHTKIILTINNRDGKYSPRNPNSPLFGLIGRNTPIRIAVRADYRGAGEVTAWPQRWDKTGRDIWVPLQAAGILRRLAQGAKPLRSSATRSYLRGSITYTASGGIVSPSGAVLPLAYWPMEDSSDATVASSEIDGVEPMRPSGSFSFGSETPAAGSAPLLKLNDTTGAISGTIPQSAYPSDWTDSDGTSLSYLFSFADDETSNADLISVTFEDSIGYIWKFELGLSGAVSNGAYTFEMSRWPAGKPGLTTILDSGTKGRASIDPYEVMHIGIRFVGGQIGWQVGWSSGGGAGIGGFVAGTTQGKITKVTIDAMATLNNLVVGHVVLLPNSGLSVTKIYQATLGNVGETVFDRLTRLCAEEGIQFRYLGVPSSGTTMGVQRQATLIDLLFDCEGVDQGILYESRDVLGLEYRTLETLYNQTPKLQLNYALNHLAGEVPEPVPDDQNVRNSIKVTRVPNGASVTATLSEGPLSTQPVPEGVGIYDEDISVNTETDESLFEIAAFRLALGTLDKDRFPNIEVWLQRKIFSSDTDLSLRAASVDVGDLLTVTNLPDFIPPEDIKQLAQGSIETLSNHRREIKWNCSPADIYDIGVWDNFNSKWDSAHTFTNAAFVAGTDTSMTVAIDTGKLAWVTGSGAPQFPFDIIVAGVRLEVTAIASATSPQTFTITQTPVNGITKTIPSGSQVRLFRPVHWAV